MADPLQPGSVFAGHRIEGLAGRGGMGVVYKATHLALDHVVALKVISPELASDERFRRRFGEESRIAVSIRHPNVVAIHHAGEEDGLLFVTMDLIDGTDLRGLLGAKGPMSPDHAAAVIAEVAAALDAAHARGLVHRDIKPGNILIEGEGPDERVYLTDFGLARMVEASTGVTATGAFVGTLDYVAPEQIRGERVDARADVYALGCVLFELLTGHPPFAARDDKVAKMYAHLQEEPPRVRLRRPELPGELDLVVARALAKEPEDRFPSAGDFARAVTAAVQGQPTVEAERSVAIGAAAPGPADATTTAERTRLAATAERQADPAPIAPSAAATTPTPTPPRKPRRGALIVSGAVMAAVIAVVAVVALAGGGGDDGGGGGAPDTSSTAGGGRTAPATPNAEIDGKPVPVGKLPVNVVHGQEGIWTTNRLGDSVSLVDGDPAKQLAEFGLAFKPEGIAVGDGSIWVGGYNAPTLLRLSPGDGTVEDQIAVGAPPGNVAFAEGAIWVANSGATTVSKVDTASGAVRTITVGKSPYGLAAGDGGLWVTNRLDGTIQRINPVNANPDPPIEVGSNPKGIAVANGSEWVANSGDGTVSVVSNGLEQDTIDVGTEPRGVAAGFGSVWVAIGGGDSVVRIDPESAKVAQTIEVGHGPEGITVGPKSVWVANGQDDTLTRIDPGVQP